MTGDRFKTGAEKRAGVGYEFAHSAIDDHSRLAYTELHRDEKAATVVGFTQRAIAFFAAHGIRIERWQTDNAWVYTKNTDFQALLAAHGIRHRTIPPRTPKRNGKVERYQQTLKREWGLGQRYRSSDARAAALPHWLHHYNNERNHSSIGNRPPITPGLLQVVDDARQRAGPGRPPVRYRYVAGLTGTLDRSDGELAVFAATAEDLGRRRRAKTRDRVGVDAEVWMAPEDFERVCELAVLPRRTGWAIARSGISCSAISKDIVGKVQQMRGCAA